MQGHRVIRPGGGFCHCENQAPRDTHRAKLAKKTLWKELFTQKKTEGRCRPHTVRERFSAHLKGSRVLSGPTMLPVL